jgi:hypothetical protein
MLQRIQTVWLLVASACGFLSLKASFFIGSISTEAASNFTGMNDLLIMILSIISATIAFVAIFLYMTRPLQFKMILAAFILNAVVLVLYFLAFKKYTTGGIALGSVASFAIPILLVLAGAGIYKDDKLVKSLDRLR